MKKSIIYLLCAVIVTGSVAFLNSCGKNEQQEPEKTEYQTKASSQAEEIVNVPDGKSEIADIFQAAINYVDGYCYGYTKNTEITVRDLSLGSLGSVSNAQDAFRSIFGEKKSTADYNYNTDKDAFGTNFPNGTFSADNITTAKAEQKDGIITVTVTFPDETNPQDSGILSRLGGDFLNAEKIQSNLSDFASSAKSVSVTASDITVVARINASDSRLVSMNVSYTERFSLSGVTLVKIDGGAVSGKADFKISYTDIG